MLRNCQIQVKSVANCSRSKKKLWSRICMQRMLMAICQSVFGKGNKLDQVWEVEPVTLRIVSPKALWLMVINVSSTKRYILDSFKICSYETSHKVREIFTICISFLIHCICAEVILFKKTWTFMNLNYRLVELESPATSFNGNTNWLVCQSLLKWLFVILWYIFITIYGDDLGIFLKEELTKSMTYHILI